MTPPAAKKPVVMIIDPDPVVCDLLQYNLAVDYAVQTVANAEEARPLLPGDFALVVMEVDLPGQDGLSFATALHNTPLTAGIPLIFCSNRDSEDDIVAGFDAGADDYVVKPFSLREITARIRSVIRRHALTAARQAARQTPPMPAAAPADAPGPDAASGAAPAPAVPAEQSADTDICAGNLLFRADLRRFEVDGKPVPLSRTEHLILLLLMRNPGVTFTREQIQARVWGPGANADNSRAVDVNISRLRKKLGPASLHITNIPGRGYTLA